MTNRQFCAALLVILGAALALRLPNLGNRLFHGDEAVHAVKVQDLRETGVYKYDPNEYHGPTLYYADLPILALSGHGTFAQTTESDYRIAPALFGAFMVLLVWLLRGGIGDRAALIAGLFLAVSPAFVFYSRYFIQEIFLAFFTLAMIGCGWRYHKSGKIGWLIAAGASAGAMIATKETAPIAFFAAAVAALLARNRTPIPSAAESPKGDFTLMEDGNSIPRCYHPDSREILLAIGTAVGVAFILLSSFLMNPAGPLGYLHSYAPWLTRTGSQGIHNHPWSYYFAVLAWAPSDRGRVSIELLLYACALAGIILAFRRNGHHESALPRFIAVWTLLVTIAYCVIPYKTPWCVLTFLGGILIMAGVGAEYLLLLARLKFMRLTLYVLLGVILGGTAAQTYAISFKYQNDEKNPYVYGAPVREVVDLSQKVADIVKQSPDGDSTVIKLVSSDEYYWPLPWYLRWFTNVGYYVGMPADPAAPIIIASPSFEDALTEKLGNRYLMTGFYGLRPGIPMQMWVELKLWTRYINSLGPRKPVIGE